MAQARPFRVVSFGNRGGSRSYRVTGWLRGRRIRENYGDRRKADLRQHELERERLGVQALELDRMHRSWLSEDQLHAAEWLFHRQPDPEEVRRAWTFWETRGRKLDAAQRACADLSLDDAAGRFSEYVSNAPDLRRPTKVNLLSRVRWFVADQGRLPLAGVTAEIIEAWLARRQETVSAVTADNDRRALSRFFSWCVARPQRFIAANPAGEVRVARPEKGPPEIYTVRQALRLLAAARRFRGGHFLPVITLGLFAGLRPTEALRFDRRRVKDGLVRLEATETKTAKPRVIEADPLFLAWLREWPRDTVPAPAGTRQSWARFLKLARVRWIPDGLRHTAVSHFFRRCGSYGLTAEWAGNSEAVIKAHYQARTSAAETAAFWSLFPARADRAAARAKSAPAGLIPFPEPRTAGRRRPAKDRGAA